MGKNLIQQARGKGGPSYRSPSFRFLTDAKHPALGKEQSGIITDFVKCQGHSAPLAEVSYQDGSTAYILAPEGVKVGDSINATSQAPAMGSVATLASIPEGTNIYNIEKQPGDGGRYCRAGGTTARLVSKTETHAIIILPSKKEKQILLTCRASIGIIAGGNRKDKPFLKAGAVHHAKRARNKRYPMISGAAQNAVDHPFGNKRTSRKAKQKPIPRFAPAGRKVGKLHPRRTGRKK